jgi:hypothetical protein
MGGKASRLFSPPGRRTSPPTSPRCRNPLPLFAPDLSSVLSFREWLGDADVCGSPSCFQSSFASLFSIYLGTNMNYRIIVLELVEEYEFLIGKN